MSGSGLTRWVAEHRPPGPFRPGFWRSPIRGPWLTSVLGRVLLFGVPVMFLTGLASYLAYNPGLAGNDTKGPGAALTFVLFDWPTRPYWGYRFTQGLHVSLGVVLLPIVLAKLWSVIPKLFVWPPARSPAHALERASLFVLVGGAVLTFATGLLNIQHWYVFPGSFYRLHYYTAWMFIAGLVAHVVFKFSGMRAALRERRLRDELKVDLAHTAPEPYTEGGLVTPNPAEPTISRRGALGLVGAASLTLFLATAGQAIGGPLRRVSLLAPRGGFTPGEGPNDFPVNTFAAEARIDPVAAGGAWRLVVAGTGQTQLVFTRAQLLAMPQHAAHLPIACVEGWSTGDQRWEGVRLGDLARLAGMKNPASVYVESLQQEGQFARGRLAGNQIAHPDSLLALRVNGVDLSLDHGFPARVIVPNNPGVRNTKWVNKLTFET